MRTLEFRLYPSRAQEQQLTAWLELHRRVWNFGLQLLHELDRFSAYDKASRARVPCCPIRWKYRWQKDDNDAWVAIPFSELREHPNAAISCPLPQPYRPPRLSSDSAFALGAFFAKKNHPGWSELHSCPVAITRGTLQQLAAAWDAFKKGKRKQPRFKSLRTPITTLSHTDSTRYVQVDGNSIHLPVLGEARIRGNTGSRRWPPDLPVRTYRIQREPSGWYLLLVGDIPPPTVRTTELAVGLDAGVAHALTTSTGRHIDGPKALAASLRKLQRLQQQLSRQQRGGANWRKTVEQIKTTHETIRRTRRLFAHKTSTYLLRTYDTVALEDLKLQSLVRRPAPKPTEDGGYLPNNASAKAGLNRAILDTGLGQIRSMLEAKAGERGRTVVRVPATHTSQRCSCCGHTEPGNRPSQAVFHCLSCGHTEHADVNAAKNVLAAAVRPADDGTAGGRTRTTLRSPRFKRGASACSATVPTGPVSPSSAGVTGSGRPIW